MAEYDFNPAAITPVVPRGRPVKDLDPHLVECRLTPPDGKQPVFNTEPFTKFVAFEEGGEGTAKQLHYHILLETTMSDYRLAQYWNESFPAGKGTGNKLFRNGKPHEKTYSYIAKHKTPVVVKGFAQNDLDAWYVESDEYVAALKREREHYRKIKSKGRKAELKSVEDDVVQYIKAQNYDSEYDTSRICRRIVEKFLQLCKERCYDFPSRTQMDAIVYRIVYDIHPQYIDALYSRNYNLG